MRATSLSTGSNPKRWRKRSLILVGLLDLHITPRVNNAQQLLAPRPRAACSSSSSLAGEDSYVWLQRETQLRLSGVAIVQEESDDA